VTEFLRLLWGTVIHRPYVYLFFLVYLVFALRHLGALRTLQFTVLAYWIAFLSEFSATRNGFPFGRYVYLDSARVRELWISNVPFWDSLSFVFLSYFSAVISQALSPRWVALRTGILMMLLDVVIDPLTLKGDLWFLGKIYYYPEPGIYFGVTVANFVGWCFVGAVTQKTFQLLSPYLPGRAPLELRTLWLWGALGVYAGVFFFNLFITAMIQDYPLLVASSLVTGVTLGSVGVVFYRRYPLFDRKLVSCAS
jgi:uncharacterized membrane protein